MSIGERTHCISSINGPLIRETMEEIASNVWLARVAHLAGRTGTSSGILPTRGLVVSEAMNFSLPVIVSERVGCAGDLVRHGWNGYVILHSDTSALAESMTSLLSNESVRREFGARSAGIVSDYGIEACADGIVEGCLAAACKRKPSRSAMRTPVGKALSGFFCTVKILLAVSNTLQSAGSVHYFAGILARCQLRR